MRFEKRGFTLIELLIVIIIVGVLATLAIPQYGKFVEKARAAEALAMIDALKTGETAYKLEVGNYSATLSDLNVDNAKESDAAAVSAGQFWHYAVGTITGGYGITATRSSKAGGITSENIRFNWNDTSGVTWTGNHPGRPRQ